MALANQFDVKEPQDLLRGLSNVLSEYELLKEDWVAGDRLVYDRCYKWPRDKLGQTKVLIMDHSHGGTFFAAQPLRPQLALLAAAP